MKTEINKDSVFIGGIEYAPISSINNAMANKVDGLKLVMIRTYSAGVHYGYLKSRNGKEVELINSVRLWQWSGAASISQLSIEGTTKPNDCKFAIEVPYLILTEAIEIIDITEKAAINLNSVKKWKI